MATSETAPSLEPTDRTWATHPDRSIDMRNYLLAVLFAPAVALSQSVVLDWPNLPCTTMLQCDSGCTACNMADASSATFIGTNLGTQGVDICPLPVGGGDNMLSTYGWSMVPENGHRLFVSFLAFEPMHIDSIIIEHRSGTDGPQRLKVSATLNGAEPVMLGDVPAPSSFTSTVLVEDLCVEAGTGMVYGFLELMLQAYQSDGGSWDLDAIRVAGTPCAVNGISEILPEVLQHGGRMHDVLGRPVPANGTNGVYMTGRKRFVVY